MNMQLRSAKPILMIGLAALAFLTAVGCAAAAKAFGLIDSLTVKRIGSIGIGMVLIVAGNFVPKMRLFESQGYPPLRALAAQRFSGWALVLSGLVIVALWAFVASEQTILTSSIVGLGAFALTGAAWAWLALGPREAPAATADQAGDASIRSSARHALLFILLGLFWAFAIFFTDHLWGDQASTWMSLAFTIMLVVIVPFCRPKPAK